MNTYSSFRGIILLSLLFGALLSCNRTEQDIITKELNSNWTFQQLNDTISGEAIVPGTVHTDLLNAGIIEDPFYRMNEHDLQWIDKADWKYECTFTAGKEILHRSNTELLFKGLDTYADVYLNDSIILQADNMFREWKVDCKGLVKEENTLTILFRSPTKTAEKIYDNYEYVVPVSANDLSVIGGMGDKRVSAHIRKAPYHFGWDWGPRLVTSGIWRPVILKAWDEVKIEDVHIRQLQLDTVAEMIAEIEINVNKGVETTISLFIDDIKAEEKKVSTIGGKQKISLPFTINNYERWWPNGLGDQKLYNIKVTLKYGNQSDEYLVKTGLREIDLVMEDDTMGTSFYFKVNGQPVFMKGANYIPQDIFLTRVTKEDYEKLIDDALDANMNMLRIWGGGIYENDYFYELCDKKGLLVWQDFMFACSMYPGDDSFLSNVEQEAIENVKRLRNHPSIALWCGNNECLSAWENWGWNKTAAEEQGQEVADRIWAAYDTLFHNILDSVVAIYDSDRAYWPSSPSRAYGVNEKWDSKSGDVHYWGVWWGKEAFSAYDSIIPRFMSEYGFQSFPIMETVEQYTLPEDHDIYSEVMKSHQRSSIGNETIEEYMRRDYRVPEDFESFLYVSQLLQAEGIKRGMEAHRREMERCMGSLYWQINDCWPVASWSGRDYFGRWKALHYSVRHAFRDLLISTYIKDDIIHVDVVSDKLEDIDGELSFKLFNFNGELLKEEHFDLTIKGNQSNRVWRETKDKWIRGDDPASLLFLVSFESKAGDHYENKLYFNSPKDLALEKPDIKIYNEKIDEGCRIVLTTDKLVKNLYLSTDLDGFFTDNFFDLIPGIEKTIIFETKEKKDQILNKIRMMSLVDTYQQQEG